MKRIILIHTLNNFSGSPKILAILATDLIEKGYSVTIITSKGPGFLSNIPGATYINNHYQWSPSKLKTLINFAFYQIWLFFKILGYKSHNTIFYINTITPIGAAWACKLTNKERIYHIHENMLLKKPLFNIYRTTYRYCNEKSIFVSKYIQKITPTNKPYKVIYDAIDNQFIAEAKHYLSCSHKHEQDNILMICSLRRYKGIYEFIELSQQLPQYQFVLVVSATQQEVDKFKSEITCGANIHIYTTQTNLHKFYQQAKILLQLSHTDTRIETFGLTILEAMTYGVPVIGPNIGGPTEVIDNGVNGYHVDTQNINEIKSRINELMQNPIQYDNFSKSAINKAAQFNSIIMCNEIEHYLCNN